MITVILAIFAWGFFAHGFMIFNKLSIHDDIHNVFDVGATFYSGRWALGILEKVTEAYLGGIFSMPVFNGIMTMIFVALILLTLVELFSIASVY